MFCTELPFRRNVKNKTKKMYKIKPKTTFSVWNVYFYEDTQSN